MFQRLLARLSFDRDWYLSNYPDVAEAVELGLFRHPFDHYWDFGRREGRLPYEPRWFDETWYLEIYKDVRVGIARRDFENAYDHYLKAGCREGRLPAPLHFNISVKDCPPSRAP